VFEEQEFTAFDTAICLNAEIDRFPVAACLVLLCKDLSA
jgi:hypothetical protein